MKELNERWLELAAVDVWSQVMMKEPIDSLERIVAAPRTGVWQFSEDGELISLGLPTIGTTSPEKTKCSFSDFSGRVKFATRELI